MFLIKLIRFLLGYVEFTCEGGFSERFVNLCFANGIRLWDVRSSGGVTSAKASLSAFKKIDIPAEKSGMTVYEKYRRGLPVIIYNNRSRAVFLVSSVLTCVLVFILSSMIWSVTVSGGESYTDKQIIDIFASYGVKPGVFADNIDVDYVQDSVVESNPDIIWCSVNIVGSRAFIEIRESVKTPDMHTDDNPSNIVAPCDGVLTRLEVYSGEGVVSVGSAVLKGQLLISGTLERTDGSVKAVNADGKVEIRRNDFLSFAVGESDPRFSVKEMKTRSSVYFLGLKIPLGITRDCDKKSRTEKLLTANGVTLPVGTVTDRFLFLQPGNSPLDSPNLLLLAGYEYFKNEKNTVLGCEIESRALSYSIENGVCTVDGKYFLTDKEIVRQNIIFED